MIKKAFWTIILGLCVGFYAQAARIENLSGVPTSGDFLVFPARKEIILDKDRSASFELSILNRTGATQEYDLEINDIRGSQDGEQGFEIGDYSDFSHALKQYILLNDERIILESSQVAHIPISINFPKENIAGGYYAMVFVSQKNLASSGETKVSPRLGVPLLVKIAGAENPIGQLKDFRVLTNLNSNPNFDLRLYFENSGNVHLMPEGKISIYDMFGKLLAQKEITKFYSLPGSYKMVKGAWDSTSQAGYYKVEAELKRGYTDKNGQEIVDRISRSVFLVSQGTKFSLIAGMIIVVIFLIFFLVKKQC